MRVLGLDAKKIPTIVSPVPTTSSPRTSPVEHDAKKAPVFKRSSWNKSVEEKTKKASAFKTNPWTPSVASTAENAPVAVKVDTETKPSSNVSERIVENEATTEQPHVATSPIIIDAVGITSVNKAEGLSEAPVTAAELSEGEEIPWDERLDFVQERMPLVSELGQSAAEVPRVSEDNLVRKDTFETSDEFDELRDETKDKSVENGEEKQIELNKERRIELNNGVPEPRGRRPQENYTRPPPNFKIAKARRKRDRATPHRRKYFEAPMVAEPRGKRLPSIIHVLPKKDDSKNHPPQDCEGLGPHNRYRLRPPPVDTPGVKHGELALEEKLELMKRQVILAEQIEIIRELKQLRRDLLDSTSIARTADHNNGLLWSKDRPQIKKTVTFEDLETKSLPAQKVIDMRLEDKDEASVGCPKLSWWRSIREALQDQPTIQIKMESSNNNIRPIQLGEPLRETQSFVGADQTTAHGEEDQPYDERFGVTAKASLGPEPTISAIQSNSFYGNTYYSSIARASTGMNTPSYNPNISKPAQNVFRGLSQDHTAADTKRGDDYITWSKIQALEKEKAYLESQLFQLMNDDLTTREILDLEREKAQLGTHLLHLAASKGFGGAFREQKEEVDQWRKALRSATVLTM